MNPKVDTWLGKAKKWRGELGELRAILLDSPLAEEWKWNKPCYTFQGSNIVIIATLKESCALGFFKGVLLKDPKGILLRPGEHSQSSRWAKFTSLREIAALEPVIKAYIREALEVEKAGLKVEFKKNPEPVPAELKKKMKENAALKKAFQALTPGRQRGYILYISGAKQSKTRESRIEKWMPHILKGKGMQDR